MIAVERVELVRGGRTERCDSRLRMAEMLANASTPPLRVVTVRFTEVAWSGEPKRSRERVAAGELRADDDVL